MPSMQPACMRHGQSSSKVTYCAIDSDVVTSWAFSLEAQALTLCLHTHTCVPKLRHTQACTSTGIQIHPHAGTQTHRYTNTWRHWHTQRDTQKCTHTQWHICAGAQVCTDTQTYALMCTQAHTAVTAQAKVSKCLY